MDAIRSERVAAAENHTVEHTQFARSSRVQPEGGATRRRPLVIAIAARAYLDRAAALWIAPF
jgi:hypothetical protein